MTRETEIERDECSHSLLITDKTQVSYNSCIVSQTEVAIMHSSHPNRILTVDTGWPLFSYSVLIKTPFFLHLLGQSDHDDKRKKATKSMFEKAWQNDIMWIETEKVEEWKNRTFRSGDLNLNLFTCEHVIEEKWWYHLKTLTAYHSTSLLR